MRRINYIWLAGIVFTGLLAGTALCQTSAAPNQDTAASGQSSAAPPADNQGQSLGSYARAVRKTKAPEAAKKFDNDNIPKSDTISVVGSGSAASQPAAADDKTQAEAQAQSANNANQLPSVTPGQSQEQRQQVYEEWQGKISEQQGKIEGIAHELDLEQREYRLKAASFYGDAGERLRNAGQWDKEDTDYKQKIADKQKALDDAKQALNDLQEQARKAGVPASAQQPPADSSPE